MKGRSEKTVFIVAVWHPWQSSPEEFPHRADCLPGGLGKGFSQEQQAHLFKAENVRAGELKLFDALRGNCPK